MSVCSWRSPTPDPPSTCRDHLTSPPSSSPLRSGSPHLGVSRGNGSPWSSRWGSSAFPPYPSTPPPARLGPASAGEELHPEPPARLLSSPSPLYGVSSFTALWRGAVLLLSLYVSPSAPQVGIDVSTPHPSHQESTPCTPPPPHLWRSCVGPTPPRESNHQDSDQTFVCKQKL